MLVAAGDSRGDTNDTSGYSPYPGNMVRVGVRVRVRVSVRVRVRVRVRVQIS